MKAPKDFSAFGQVHTRLAQTGTKAMSRREQEHQNARRQAMVNLNLKAPSFLAASAKKRERDTDTWALPSSDSAAITGDINIETNWTPMK